LTDKTQIKKTAIIKTEKKIYSYQETRLIWRQICRLKDKSYTYHEIHDLLNVSVSVIQDVIKKYKDLNKDSKSNKDNESNKKTKLIPTPKIRGRKNGEKRILSKQQEIEIKRLLVDKNPSQLEFECFLWNLNTVREFIKQKYSIAISKESIRRYLEEWGMSYQRPAKRAYNQKEVDICAFKTLIFPEIKRLAKEENAEIYFGDETGVNNQSYNPAGYSLKNNPPIVQFQTSRETINMLSAISPSGEHKFMLYEDSTTQQKLIEFMQNLIKDKQKNKDKVYLILDNLKVHHGKLIKTFIEENKTKISIFYFPSYSPELNPDEYLNNVLKMYIHTGFPPKTKEQIKTKMEKYMHSITPEQIQKLFLHPKLSYQEIF